MYIVYDMKNKEQVVAIFDRRYEVAEFFKTTSNYIGTAITRKQKIKWRYLIERVK